MLMRKAFYEEFIQSYKLSKKREAFLLILLNERIRLILLLNTSFQLPFLGKRTTMIESHLTIFPYN